MDDDVKLEIKQMNTPENQPHRFVWRFEYNKDKSIKAGRPIFDPCVFIEVVSEEGSVRDIKYVKANDIHKKNFPTAWNLFKKNIAPEVDLGIKDPLTIEEFKESFPEHYERYKERVASQKGGTLLVEWGQCPARLALELKYLGIFTVEDLLEDNNEDLVPENLITAAKEYLLSSEDAGRINVLATSLIKAKEIIDRQDKQIELLKRKGV